jgi:hypothetical protein
MFRIIRTLALVLSLAGCATAPDVNQQRMEMMPQHYAQFDALIGWEVRSAGPATVITGEFKNIRYLYMDNVEIWVAALGPNGKPSARSVAYLIPHQLERGRSTPFTLKLPVAVEPGSKLRFTYKYTGIDGASPEGGGDVGPWMQTFDAVVPEM